MQTKRVLLSLLSAPARRALERLGIVSAEDLAKHSEAEILALHGMGPGSLPKLKRALADAGLAFRKA
ncbi:MAG TPA: DNA-directed RNA polymerase subunit alpha C-terminal domain-containing protein [Gemmatimonadaceae bacterium]|jgi:DNA-directed RNA polymerase alpha subunit